MFASAPMGLTALCLFQAGAQMEAGARLESRVGEIPSAGTMVMLLATPSLRLDWFAGADVFQADLSSRVLWRPVPLPHDRPLFLETLGLVHNARPSPRSQWHFDLHASYGEQDYTSLSQQFTTQPTLPFATTMFMVNGAADVLWRSSRRTTLALHVGAAHRRSLENQADAGVSLLPTQTMVSVAPEMRMTATRRLTAEFSVPLSGYDVQGSGNTQALNGPVKVYSVQPQIHLLERVTRHDRLRLALGLTYADVVSGTRANFGNRLTPLGLVGLDSDLYSSRSSSLRSSVSFETTWFVDPVLGLGVWRGIAQAGLDAHMGLRWGAGLHVSSATDISKPPAAFAQMDGTLVSADALLRYRWTNVFVAELGGRYSDRGPRLVSSDFAWRGREVWGYLTLYTASRMPLTSLRPIQPITGSGL